MLSRISPLKVFQSLLSNTISQGLFFITVIKNKDVLNNESLYQTLDEILEKEFAKESKSDIVVMQLKPIRAYAGSM